VNATITANLRSSLCFGIPPSASGSFSLAITYRGEPEEGSENLPFARFTSYPQVNKADLPMEASWAICVRSPGYSNCFELGYTQANKFLVWVKFYSTYVISATHPPWIGRLEKTTDSSFTINASNLFLPWVQHFLMGT
jgi:hypothetical protein